MVSDTIEREIIIDAPVARVWDALTVADQIAGWFGDSAEIDLRPGGSATFRWQEHGAFPIAIERVEPHRFFSWRWSQEVNTAPQSGKSTLVEFTLTPEGSQTRLRVVESGFASLDMPAEEQTRNWEMNTQGWHDELNELRDFVQRVAV